MKFSRTEIRDIIISTAALAFAFSFPDIGAFPEVLFVVGIAFLSHELIGHRFVAHRLGAAAEFKAWPTGLLFAVLMAVATGGRIVFAAPGAVYFSPTVKGDFAWTVHRMGKREIGLIGVAGPVVNIIIGFAALALFVISGFGLLLSLMRISLFLAFFNLLPFGPLDGQKVMQWDWRIWAAAIALSAVGYLL